MGETMGQVKVTSLKTSLATPVNTKQHGNNRGMMGHDGDNVEMTGEVWKQWLLHGLDWLIASICLN